MSEEIKYGTEFLDQLKDKVHDQYDEIERLNNEIKTLLQENGNKEKVIIAQDNIIKEVREYIEENKASLPMGRDDFTCEMRYSDLVVLASKLLEILDIRENKINEVMSVEELESYEPKNIAEQEYQDWFWD